MAIQVDELVSDVSVEPEPAPGPTSGPAAEWATLARAREQRRRLLEDALRTVAEGFDD